MALPIPVRADTSTSGGIEKVHEGVRDVSSSARVYLPCVIFDSVRAVLAGVRTCGFCVIRRKPKTNMT